MSLSHRYLRSVLWFLVDVQLLFHSPCSHSNLPRTRPVKRCFLVLVKLCTDKPTTHTSQWFSCPDPQEISSTKRALRAARAEVLPRPRREGWHRGREKEGGKEAERWIIPGIVGVAPGTLCCGFLSPALHLCGPSTSHKSLLMSGCEKKKHNEGRAEWLTDPRSALRLSHRGGRQVRLETSLFGQAPLASMYEQTHTQQRSSPLRFHTRLPGRSYMHSAACTLNYTLTYGPSKKKNSFSLWGENLLTVLFGLYSDHTHTHKHRLMIYILMYCLFRCAPNGRQNSRPRSFLPWTATFLKKFIWTVS